VLVSGDRVAATARALSTSADPSIALPAGVERLLAEGPLSLQLLAGSRFTLELPGGGGFYDPGPARPGAGPGGPRGGALSAGLRHDASTWTAIDTSATRLGIAG
jgi:hypothetical protein